MRENRYEIQVGFLIMKQTVPVSNSVSKDSLDVSRIERS